MQFDVVSDGVERVSAQDQRLQLGKRREFPDLIPVADAVVVEEERLEPGEEGQRLGADRRQAVAADLELPEMRKPLADVLQIRPIDLRVRHIEKVEFRKRKPARQSHHFRVAQGVAR